MTSSSLPDQVYRQPWRLTPQERNTVTCLESPDDGMLCQRTVYLGFFFDGTGNNLHYDKAKQAHSNVARLYEAFEDKLRPDEGRQYRYATYIPGVATEFRKEIGDTGVGLHAMAGAAAGWGGEARINWALLQLQNNLHRYAFGNQPLSDEAQDRALVARMSDDITLPPMQALRNNTDPRLTPYSAQDRQLRGKTSFLHVFQAIASTQWRYSNVDGRRTVLAERRARLRQKLMPVLTGKLPRIARMCISVFGFSRGATAARVFVNWMRDLCDNAEGPMRICGVPATIDFLGLFDTVASVGATQGLLELVADGHGGWAQRRDLRIPDSEVVTRCLHLVAGHEVRGSFPLDAAAGPQVKEVVYPGAHSDVGGGYRPAEQHRGMSDAAKLSQIPLCHMYRVAVAAGVPLQDLTHASPELQNAFRVDGGLISRFNAYLESLPRAAGSTTQALIRHHYKAFLHWRRYHVKKFDKLPLPVRRQERADLLDANTELVFEWDLLSRMDEALTRTASSKSRKRDYLGWLVKLKVTNEREAAKVAVALAMGSAGGPAARAYFDDLPSSWLANISPSADGVIQSYRLIHAAEKALKSKYEQWAQVKQAWNQTGAPPPAIDALLTQDVHDSRASFKPLGEEEDVWVEKSRQRMRVLANKPTLTQQERNDRDDYLTRMNKAGVADTDWAAVSEAVPPQRGGREFSALWGYLRWRTVYADVLMDFKHLFPQWAEAKRIPLLKRKHELEREAGQIRLGRSEQTRIMSQSISMGGMMRGTSSIPNFGQARDWSGRLREIEIELIAVQRFLEELGPSSWWEEVQAAVVPG